VPTDNSKHLSPPEWFEENTPPVDADYNMPVPVDDCDQGG